MNRTTFCCLSLTAALILTACSSGGGGSGGGGVAADIGTGLADALTAPLDHKDKGLQSLMLDQSVRKNEKLKLSAQGAEKTYGNGDSLNTGKLKNDKVSRFDDEKGSYSLGIFGGQAQEVAGSAEVETANGIQHIGLAAKQ